MTILDKVIRPIRSYVLRQGRMTPSQTRAIADLWPHYGLQTANEKNYLSWEAIFQRQAPRILEIGFGMGDNLYSLACKYPEKDFIGIEVHQPGVGRCLAQAQAQALTNLKVFAQDAILVLENSIPNESIDKILLLFPDPWPKKKHHKRRIVQKSFIELVARKLKNKGQFHLATDWQPYAEHMLSVLDNHPALTNQFGAGNFAPSGFERFPTKFEQRGQKLGHAIWDLVYLRR